MYTTDNSRNDHPRWWQPGAMRFFRTRVCWSSETPVSLPDGTPAVAFVTSEEGPDGWRGYCVRLHTAEDVTTIDDDGARSQVRSYDTRAQAIGALRRWVKAGCPVPVD